MSSYPFKGESSAEPGWVAKDKSHSTPDQCEPLSRYTVGGLCPILIGDILKGKDLTRPDRDCFYEVIAKLGFGSTCTVWLGKNTAEDGGYLALKVLESRLSGRGNENPELCMLQKLGRLRVAFMYEHPGLDLEADQSHFLVLGMEPLGQRFDHRDILEGSDDEDEKDEEEEDEDEDEGVDKDNPDRKYDSKTALAKTILTTVLELHEKGICHNNFDPSSLAYGLHRDAFKPEVLEDKLLDEQRELYVIFEGLDESPQCPAHLPEHLISHHDMVWGCLKSNWRDKTIVDLMGFGKAFNISEGSPLYQGQEEHYTAPEVLRDGKPATLQSDLWSLGCLIFYALARRHLFKPDHTPQSVCDKIYENFTKEFDADSQHFFIRANLLNMWDQKYKDLATRLVRCLLRSDPADRDVEAAKEIIKEMEAYKFDPKYKSTLLEESEDGFSDSDEGDYDDDDDEGPIDLLAEIRAMALKEEAKDV